MPFSESLKISHMYKHTLPDCQQDDTKFPAARADLLKTIGMRCCISIAAGFMALLIVGCQTAPLTANVTKLSSADIAPLIASQKGPRHPWHYFIFDIQVQADTGGLLAQINGELYAHHMLGATRALMQSGGIGRYNDIITMQTSTGLWSDPHLKKERARVAVDFGWPSDLGDFPANFSAGKVTQINLQCAPWAQALAAQESGKVRYDKLARALTMRYQNTEISATQPLAPYRLNEYWIIPLLITLPKQNFADLCLPAL